MRTARFICVLLLVTTACTSTEVSPPMNGATTTAAGAAPTTAAANTTHWGFSPFPFDTTEAAIGEVFTFVAREGDIVAHHFDGVWPWSSLLDGAPLPVSFEAELAGRAAFNDANPHLAVYVATALTNLERTGIPEAMKGDAVPSDIADSLADVSVTRAAREWVSLLVDRLKPDYLNLAVEIVLYAAKRPDDAEHALQLYEELAASVSEQHPEIVVFASFQAELGNPAILEMLVDEVDLIGVSTYPHILNGGSVPESGWLDRFIGHGKPIAVTETGFPAGVAGSPSGTVRGSPEAQADYVRRLAELSTSEDVVFVIWFFPYDIDRMADRSVPAAAAFTSLGMVTADGEERLALVEWRAARNR